MHVNTCRHKTPVQSSDFRKCTKDLWSIRLACYMIGDWLLALLVVRLCPDFASAVCIEWLMWMLQLPVFLHKSGTNILSHFVSLIKPWGCTVSIYYRISNMQTSQFTFFLKLIPIHAIGSNLNLLVGKFSEDTRTKGKGAKTGACRDRRSFYLPQYDWLKVSHMASVVWPPNESLYSICAVIWFVTA